MPSYFWMMFQYFKEKGFYFLSYKVQIFTIKGQFRCPHSFLRYMSVFYRKKTFIYKQVHANSPVSQCTYRCWNGQASKRSSHFGQKTCLSQEKIVFSLLNYYRQDLLKQLYQFLCILLKKLFHWNRLDRRKYKECDLVSFLGRDAGPEDIYIRIRLSAQ